MDKRGMKCTKCIKDKQGCFWNKVSLAGKKKKGYESDKKSEDDGVKEIEALWVLRKKGSMTGMTPGKSKPFAFVYVQIAELVGSSEYVGKVPPHACASLSSASIVQAVQ